MTSETHSRLTAKERIRYDGGIYMSLSSFLTMLRGGLDIPLYKVAQVYNYLAILFPILETAQLQLFESTIVDIIGLVQRNRANGILTRRLIVPTQGEATAEVFCLDRLHQRNAQQDFSLSDRLIQAIARVLKLQPLSPALLKMNQFTPQQANLNAQILTDLLAAPDLDGRIAIKQEALHPWAEEIEQQIISAFMVKSKKIIKTKEGNCQITQIQLESILSVYPVDPTEVGLSRMVHYQPYFEIKTGVWPSGIKYCNLQFGANDPLAQPYEFDKKVVIFDLGLTTKPELLPEELKNLDTRTARGLINSHECSLVPVTSTVPKVNTSMQPLKITVAQASSNTAVYLPHANLRHRNKDNEGNEGNEDANQYYFEALPTNNNSLGIFKELWIFLNQEIVNQHSQPISFAPRFGEATDPTVTFLEWFRTIRYSLRAELAIADEEQTETAFAIMRGEQTKTAKILPDQIKQLAEVTEIIVWWKKDLIKEGAVCLFYGPKEFIKHGIRAGLANYLPRWALLESIVDDLPDEAQILQRIYGPNRLFETKTGWDYVIEAIRKRYPDNEEIRKRNNIELIFSLVAID